MKTRNESVACAAALLVLCVVFATAGFTMAMWSDNVTSEDNVYATGNLDLKVRPMSSTIWTQGPLVATWHAENMYPDRARGELSVLQDAGTIEGLTFDIAVANTTRSSTWTSTSRSPDGV